MERLYTSPVSQRRTLWLWELKKTTIWRWHVLRISSGTFFMTACHYSPSGVRACYKTSHLPIKMILGRWPIYSGVIMTGITVVCCLNVSSWNSLGLGFGAIGLAGRGCTKQCGCLFVRARTRTAVRYSYGSIRLELGLVLGLKSLSLIWIYCTCQVVTQCTVV